MSEIQARIWVHCSRCGSEGIWGYEHVELREAPKVSHLAKNLRMDGWRYTKASGWVCPDCKGKKH